MPQPTPPRQGTPSDTSVASATPRIKTASHAPDAPALSAEHYAQLAAAHLAFAPVRRTLRIVTFSAATLALFAVLSLPFALFSFKAAFVAAGLVVAAYFEFRGRSAIQRLDPAGVTTLVRNQIALTVLMVAYCLWSMASAWFGPDLYADIAATKPDVGQLLEPYSDIFRQAAVGFYALVLLIGLGVQALVIRYYATRRQPIETYLTQTPAWILAWNRP